MQSWTNVTGCLGWPFPAHSPAPGASIKDAPPALILQSTNQTLSAYQWGFGLGAQLPGSRVLTFAGDDYSVYILSPCITDKVNEYLIETVLPDLGFTCSTYASHVFRLLT